MLECWNKSKYWNAGMLEYWNAGMLGLRNLGIGWLDRKFD